MKNLDLLPLEEEKKKRLKTFARMYQQNARVFIDVISFKGNRLIVRVEQKESVDGRLLNHKELIERTKGMFKDEIPEDWKLNISAVDSNKNDIESITPDWIKHRMQKFGFKGKHLSNRIGIDTSTISLLLNGEKELTKWHKSTFYYFFKYQEAAQF
ncbi:hypothetical protein AGMMS49525_03060 [Bacteroidia bacterium]|nr:hypothetical protein AGMMS49525_02990 [Bacteroidia bacterium]GHT01666.1 hypothetical protein AGMMS49525_03060 [Bacteroidia bacterium]